MAVHVADDLWAVVEPLLLERLQDAGALDWSRAALDSASLPAKKGARRSGRTPRTAAGRARSAISSPTLRAHRSAWR